MSPASSATRSRSSVGVTAAVVLALVLLLGSAAVFVLADATADDAPPAARSGPAVGVTDEDYAAADLGALEQDVEQLLLPATPLDVEVLEEYELRAPETPAASCTYYESEGGAADDLYRFCFVDDRLVGKTVVLPPEDGVTGS